MNPEPKRRAADFKQFDELPHTEDTHKNEPDQSAFRETEKPINSIFAERLLDALERARRCD